MLCLVRYLFFISTGVIDCLGRFVPRMTYYVLSGTLNLTKPISMPILLSVHNMSCSLHLLANKYEDDDYLKVSF